MRSHSLRLTVRLARSEPELRDACRVRVASYGHHLPGVASIWGEPDELDRRPDTVVLVARDKQMQAPVGTVRIATNKHGPLQIEGHVAMPRLIGEGPTAEITRLCVVPGHEDPAVKLALMKGLYLYCMAHQIQWMVIGARSESLVRQYLRLGFTDLLEEAVTVPFSHAGGLPHRVLAFHVTAAERNWHALSHPFYDFMVRSYHPDIQIFDGVPASVERTASPSAEPAVAVR